MGEPGASPFPAAGTGDRPAPAAPVWRRDPRWVFRVAADQVVLAAPDGARRTLEGQAAAVWVVLEEPGSAAEVAERVRRRWPAPPPSSRVGGAGGSDVPDEFDVPDVPDVPDAPGGLDEVDGAVARTLAMLAAHDLIGVVGPTAGSAAANGPTGPGVGPAPT